MNKQAKTPRDKKAKGLFNLSAKELKAIYGGRGKVLGLPSR